MKWLAVLALIWGNSIWALSCDCEVRALPPITGPLSAKVVVLEKIAADDFIFFNLKNAEKCRQACLKESFKELSTKKINSLLMGYAGELIDAGLSGHNCTGLTTFKFPIRVRALLDNHNLGDVRDEVYTIHHEQACF